MKQKLLEKYVKKYNKNPLTYSVKGHKVKVTSRVIDESRALFYHHCSGCEHTFTYYWPYDTSDIKNWSEFLSAIKEYKSDINKSHDFLFNHCKFHRRQKLLKNVEEIMLL